MHLTACFALSRFVLSSDVCQFFLLFFSKSGHLFGSEGKKRQIIQGRGSK